MGVDVTNRTDTRRTDKDAQMRHPAIVLEDILVELRDMRERPRPVDVVRLGRQPKGVISFQAFWAVVLGGIVLFVLGAVGSFLLGMLFAGAV